MCGSWFALDDETRDRLCEEHPDVVVRPGEHCLVCLAEEGARTMSDTSKPAEAGPSDFQLPDGFAWARSFVVLCKSCKEEYDCRTSESPTGAEWPTIFIGKHQLCLDAPGRKLASSMTLRDEFAIRALSGILSNGEYPGAVEDAVEFADDLIEALYPPPRTKTDFCREGDKTAYHAATKRS
jgi:hypothetical protein